MAQIDILMAVYNGERYVAQQIDSILAQDFKDWRLVIQDDCSSDHTLEICEGYAAKHPDKIVCSRLAANSGAADRNFYSLMEMAEAPYIMFSDHDDVWLPGKVGDTFAKMRELEWEYGAKVPLLVHTDLTVADESLAVRAYSMAKLQKLNPRPSFAQLVVQNMVTGCTVMVNRCLLARLGSPPRHAVMHDWWMALIAGAMGGIGYVDKSTILYRQHGSNEVGAKDAASLSYCGKRLKDRAGARKVLLDTCVQAEEFLQRYGECLDESQRRMLSAYSRLPEQNKARRVAILARYGLWKYGVIRKIGQICFI